MWLNGMSFEAFVKCNAKLTCVSRSEDEDEDEKQKRKRKRGGQQSTPSPPPPKPVYQRSRINQSFSLEAVHTL